ncbi:uncharacterized protein [Henckelia pumila]|uniref:uncharacterized protein n=1 Tax=Henckelia pumila TaxID=405737 RepID=UPI003C6E8933
MSPSIGVKTEDHIVREDESDSASAMYYHYNFLGEIKTLHISEGTGVTEFGMVLRDASGVFIGCRSSVFHGRLQVSEGETMSILEALSWVHNLGFQKVIFESDLKIVVDALGSSVNDLSEFASIVSQCKIIMHAYPEFIVRFVPRKANEIAHVVARNAHCCPNPSS